MYSLDIPNLVGFCVFWVVSLSVHLFCIGKRQTLLKLCCQCIFYSEFHFSILSPKPLASQLLDVLIWNSVGHKCRFAIIALEKEISLVFFSEVQATCLFHMPPQVPQQKPNCDVTCLICINFGTIIRHSFFARLGKQVDPKAGIQWLPRTFIEKLGLR